MKQKYCPGCLKPYSKGYCNSCIQNLFNGVNIPVQLNFSRAEFNQVKVEQSRGSSIPGSAIKHSLRIGPGGLELTENDPEYILKPSPSGLYDNRKDIPANEHLTMQFARQVYNINTAENGFIFFNDGEPAYITKRFDKNNDKRFLQEDFAQLSGKSEEINGKEFKYSLSYEEIAELIRLHVNAYIIETEKFFKALVFNYLFSNGNAHTRSFSLWRNEHYGDYLLTPFYGLMNTSLHIRRQQDTALNLFKDNFVTEDFQKLSYYSKNDFTEFASRAGIGEKRVKRILEELTGKTNKVEMLTSRSYLKDELKKEYLDSYYKKLDRLK